MVASVVLQVEDAESVRAVCSATHTALDCTGDLVAGERFRLAQETSALHPSTHDEPSLMKRACPA